MPVLRAECNANRGEGAGSRQERPSGGARSRKAESGHGAAWAANDQDPGQSRRPRGVARAAGGEARAWRRPGPAYCTFCTRGGVQEPSRIEGLVSFGQYMRSIGRKAPSGAGSQFASLSFPGDSFWK